MKFRSLSKSRRSLSAKNSADSEAKWLAALGGGLASREKEPEVSTYNNCQHINWAKAIAIRIIRQHWRFAKVRLDEKVVSEDAASEAVFLLYENRDVGSMSALEIQVYLLVEIKKFVSNEVREEDKYVRGLESSDEFFTPFACAATQDETIEAVRCYSLLRMLPKSVRAMAYKMADGATLAECADELGLDLMAAMRKQVVVREIVQRLIFDGMLHGIFSNICTFDERRQGMTRVKI